MFTQECFWKEIKSECWMNFNSVKTNCHTCACLPSVLEKCSSDDGKKKSTATTNPYPVLWINPRKFRFISRNRKIWQKVSMKFISFTFIPVSIPSFAVQAQNKYWLGIYSVFWTFNVAHFQTLNKLFSDRPNASNNEKGLTSFLLVFFE